MKNKIKNQIKTEAQWIIDREKIHANKYKYPDPYISDKVSLNIDCPFHGLFSMRPNNHLNGQRMS